MVLPFYIEHSNYILPKIELTHEVERSLRNVQAKPVERAGISALCPHLPRSVRESPPSSFPVYSGQLRSYYIFRSYQYFSTSRGTVYNTWTIKSPK